MRCPVRRRRRTGGRCAIILLPIAPRRAWRIQS